MKTAIKNFFTWFTKPLLRLWDKPFLAQRIEDPVEAPEKKVLYIVGTAEEPWQVELICPCGCKDKIVLPVNNSTSPRWSLKITEQNIPTLHPSIWRTKGCNSHFFLRKGKVEWV